MPLFNVYIHKTVDTIQGFGNRWIMQSDTLQHANDYAGYFVNCEKAIHSNLVSFDYARVSSVAPGDDQYINTPLSGTGSITLTSDSLPRFLALRVDMGASGGGRPSRKFFHVCQGETAQAGGLWVQTYLDAVESAFNTLFGVVAAGGTTYLCDPDGQALVNHIAKGKITYHKFSKRSRMRQTVTPG